jgi:hypothetical protein
MKGRLDQGITMEYPLNTLANPMCESLIHPEAQVLHPLGALVRTHVSQAEGDLSSLRQSGHRGEHASGTHCTNL